MRKHGSHCENQFAHVVGKSGIKNPDELRDALVNFESIDAVAIVAAPGLPSLKETFIELVSHCEKCEDRFAILAGLFGVRSDLASQIRTWQLGFALS